MTNIPSTKSPSVLTPDTKTQQVKSSIQRKSSPNSTYTSILLTFSLLIVLFVIGFFIAYRATNKPKSPTTYEECIKSKGSIIRESYPAVCVAKNGQQFIQPLSPEEKKLLESPLEEPSNNNQNLNQCIPKFAIESGPELTASEAYADECYNKTTKEDCETVDIYNSSTQNFGNADGTTDCEWRG